VGSHAWFLQLQGEQDEVIECLARGDVAAAPLDPRDRALLEYVELLTRHSYRATAEHVERLRQLGWTDPQVAEAVYVTALFAFFNRVADAFGLADPGYRQLGTGPRPGAPASASRLEGAQGRG
jgi:alkylhydroperoxidase family enzyme